MEFRNLGQKCDHCGAEIESRPKIQNGGIVIEGFEPMEHRHIDNREVRCVVTSHGEAKPYSDSNLMRKYLAKGE